MQNYRNDTNDYMRRGNCGHGYRMNNGMAPGSAPSPYSGNRNMNSCCDRDDALEECHSRWLMFRGRTGEKSMNLRKHSAVVRFSKNWINHFMEQEDASHE